MKASHEYSVTAWKCHLPSVLMVLLPFNNPELELPLSNPNTENCAAALVCVSESAFFRPNQTPALSAGSLNDNGRKFKVLLSWEQLRWCHWQYPFQEKKKSEFWIVCQLIFPHCSKCTCFLGISERIHWK